MSIFNKLLLISFAAWASGIFQQNKYVVLQEDVVVEEANSAFVAVTTNVFKYNQTVKALNLSFALKSEVPEDAKVFATAGKLINNDYHLGLIHLTKTIKEALEMEAFDLQSLFTDCRPSLIWPLRKNVEYRCLGWSPDSSKFPPNLPAGDWKVQLSFAFANKTKMAVVNWFLKLQYKK